MGFKEEQVKRALAECVWDVNKALDLLMSRGAAQAQLAEDLESLTTNSTSGAERLESQDCISKGLVPASAGCHEAAHIDSGAKLADSENSTSASVASSPRSSRQSASGSPQQNSSQGDEEEASSPCKGTSKEPERPLRLVSGSWEHAEHGQLSVRKGDFVRVWTSSETELGWIYAEEPCCSAIGGWLPTSVLTPSSKEVRWTVVQKTLPAIHQTQLSIQEGDILEVGLASISEAGWIFAKRLARSSQWTTGTEVSHESPQAGWVPTSSLGWEDEEVLPQETL